MKHKGGKGKKAPYSTVIMRIPTPIEQDVRRLVEEFFSKGVTGIEDKGVTGIEDKGVTGIEDKGVTGIENKGVTGIEDKGVTGIEDKGVTGIEDKGVTGKIIDECDIETLDFPKRLYNSLKRHQINTVDELRALFIYEGDIKGLKNIGRESIRLIEEKLAAIVLKP